MVVSLRVLPRYIRYSHSLVIFYSMNWLSHPTTLSFPKVSTTTMHLLFYFVDRPAIQLFIYIVAD